MNIPKKIARRNIGIDMLRGFCILAVILMHVNIHLNIKESFLRHILPQKVFSVLFWSGYYGVVIFFTLSGYLITSSILKRWGNLSNINLMKFYWLRFSRIIPLLTTLLIVLAVLHLTNVSGFTIGKDQTSLANAIFSALTFHINYLQIQVGYLPANWDVLWSISIEETFYLAFPVVCFFLKKDWHFVVVLIIFLVISPWARTHLFADNDLGDRNHLAYLDSIALGCMTAIILNKKTWSRWVNQLLLCTGWLMIAIVFLYQGFLFTSGITGLGLNVTILSTGVCLVLCWMHDNNRSGIEINRPWLNWLRHLGIYSYEIYLTHTFVVVPTAMFFKYFEFSENWLIPFTIFIVILSYFLGHIVFNYFSEPINLWLRRKWQTKNLENNRNSDIPLLL